MKNNKGITLVSLIGYVILSIMIISVLIAITTNFRRNFNELNVQTVHDIEFDKINLQILDEIKKGKKVSIADTTAETLIFINNNVYKYVKEDEAIYLNDNIKIAEHITNCKFEIVTQSDNKVLQVTPEMGDEKRLLEYLIEEKEHDWRKTGVNIVCNNCGRKFVIGDYVKYVPDEKTNEIIVLSSQSGYGIDQPIKQEKKTKWRVMAVEDGDKNGTNETLIIKMDGTMTQLYLGGTPGYLNGVYILNKLCRELYSSTIYGQARSINIDDVNYALGYTPKGGFYHLSGWKELTNFTTSITSLRSYSPAYTPDETSLSNYKATSYFYAIEGVTIKNKTTTPIMTTNKNVVDVVANESYWLAFQGNLPSADWVAFGIGYVAKGTPSNTIWGNFDMYNTQKTTKGMMLSFSPIVKLGILVPEKTNPYEIEQEETEHNWRKNLTTFICINCGKHYTIGQNINYVPDGKEISVTIDTAETGYSIVQTIYKEANQWKVIDVIDTDNNGTNEKLVIVMEETKTNKLYLTGRAAYNNGPDIMNRICKTLYSNSTYGEARSININDINHILEYTPSGGEYYNGGWKKLTNFRTKLNGLPTWSTIQMYFNTPDGSNTIDNLGKYVVNGYSYNISARGILTSSSYPKKEQYYSDSINDTKRALYGNYWLASKGVLPGSGGKVTFGPGHIQMNMNADGFIVMNVYTNYDSFSNYRRAKYCRKRAMPSGFSRT